MVSEENLLWAGTTVHLRADGGRLRGQLLGEIRQRRVRLEPEGRADVVRAAVQAAAADVWRDDAGAREGRAAAAERGGVHQLLLLVHDPPRPVRDPDAHRRELHQVLVAIRVGFGFVSGSCLFVFSVCFANVQTEWLVDDAVY
ncbi:hypothetical protein OH77DRAFT_1289592 [Trametes cingulata]|nr:hypothetical protein OH77DRAFT_1289592 [Trametes cingulata]